MSSGNYNGYDVPSDVTITHGLQKDEWSFGGSGGGFQHTATVDLNLTLTRDDIFLLTRSGTTTSKMDITASTSQAGSSATFRVYIKYNQQSSFDQIFVARIEKPMGQIGIGIFTPGDQGMNGIELNSTIILPANPSVPLNVFTDVPHTTQNVHDLMGIKFAALELKGSNINVDTVDVVAGEFKIISGNIKGTFNSTQALMFETGSGNIDVRVSLLAAGPVDELALEAISSKGNVKVKINLATVSNSGGVFDVSCKTSSGNMDVKFLNAPVASALNLDVRNASGPAHVYLHPTYEGNLGQKTPSTDLYIPTIQEHSVRDPTGENRHRTVSTQYLDTHRTTGTVYWGTGSLVGNVNIETANGNNTLEL